MRTRIIVVAAAILVAVGGALGGLALAGYPRTASAGDPDPPPGMHEACENMNHEGMEEMHEGMMNDGGGMEEMHEGMMNDGGHMGERMQSGMGPR